MKIMIEGSLIQFVPENTEEVKELDRLWKLIGRCETENLRLLPLGHYVPGVSKSAQFYVEGLKVKAPLPEEGRKIRYVCLICNRMEEYPEASSNPVCCGQPMYRMD